MITFSEIVKRTRLLQQKGLSKEAERLERILDKAICKTKLYGNHRNPIVESVQLMRHAQKNNDPDVSEWENIVDQIINYLYKKNIQLELF